MVDEYRLVPADVPGTKLGRKSLYERVVVEFADSQEPSAKVEMPGKKAASVAIGLRRAIRSLGYDIEVVRRGDEVYLTK